jgi:hypothetical protein
MRQIRIIVEKRSGRFVAYPLGVSKALISEGTTYEEALAGLRPGTRFYPQSFPTTLIAMHPPVLEAFVAENGDQANWAG